MGRACTMDYLIPWNQLRLIGESDRIIGIAKDTTRMKFIEREPKLICARSSVSVADLFQDWWEPLLDGS
jgi:hypothetical protein